MSLLEERTAKIAADVENKDASLWSDDDDSDKKKKQAKLGENTFFNWFFKNISNFSHL